MNKVIGFKKRNSPKRQDLGQMLKQAAVLIKDNPPLDRDKLNILSHEKLKQRFLAGLNSELIAQNFLESSAFLCAGYIADLFGKTASKTLENKWLIEYLETYLETSSPYVLQEGGDMCFLICSVFPKRASWKLMNLNFYQEAGASLYYQYYCDANKPIGFHMSQNFISMSKITNKCLKLI